MHAAWPLDPAVVHLNHGSYGACPHAVLDAQRAWRDRMEAATMRFFVLHWQDAIDVARAHLAEFLGCDEQGLVFVPNATAGVNTALASLVTPGSEIVTTDHAYNACRNALDRLAAERGARVVTAHVDFPAIDPGQAVSAVVGACTPSTRVVLLDHVTSPTGLVLDAAAIVAELAPRGIDVIVDGAHAPGMLPLEIRALAGVTAYVGNLHKWVCAPKAVGFLYVREDRRDLVRPLVTSHRIADGYHPAHDWTGTHDPTAALAVPTAIDEIARIGGGWPAVRAHNHRLALQMRDLLGEALGAAPAAPDAMLGSMAAIPVTLPAGTMPRPFERRLLEHGWEAAIIDWPRLGGTYVRVSAHLYSTLDDAARLAAHLREVGVRGVR